MSKEYLEIPINKILDEQLESLWIERLMANQKIEESKLRILLTLSMLQLARLASNDTLDEELSIDVLQREANEALIECVCLLPERARRNIALGLQEFGWHFPYH